MRTFETGAVRDDNTGRGRMDLLPWRAIIELSKHCERGAAHYGEGNVRKGIPYSSLCDSGARHLAQFISGIQDEPTHLVAACWNLMWLLEETLVRPELNDLSWSSVKTCTANAEPSVNTSCAEKLEAGYTGDYKLYNQDYTIDYVKSISYHDADNEGRT